MRLQNVNVYVWTGPEVSWIITLLGSLRNHDGNGNCNVTLLLFENFRFKRFLVFCSNLLPLRVSVP